MSKSTSDYVQFNGQNYMVKIRLVNEEVDLKIPAGIVRELIITDNIYSPFANAVLTLNNTGNSVDNFVIPGTDISYHFNMDSRDMIWLKLIPIETDGTPLNEDLWGFNHNSQSFGFIIYDEDEIVTTRGQVKSKVLYLKRYLEQNLEDNNIDFSTAKVVADQFANRINVSQVSNSMREAHTGDAIKSIIERGSPESVFFAPDWDKGGTKLFYTSGPESNAFTDLEHVLDHHISAGNNDFCLLGEERNNDMFLRSMTDIYKNAYREDLNEFGDYFIDAFSSTSGALNTSPQKEVTETVPSKVFGFTEEESGNLEGLLSFSYLNMANVDSMNELVTTAVHSYGSGDKQFSIDCRDNHIWNIKKMFQEKYTTRMRGEIPVPIIPINWDKIDNFQIKHVFAGGDTKKERLHAGVNRVLKQTFAFSPSISFDLKGSSARRTGRFVILNANHANVDSPFAKIFIGEWLTTKVIHYFSFTNNTYINSMTCVKPHANKPLSVKGVEWQDRWESEWRGKVDEFEEDDE